MKIVCPNCGVSYDLEDAAYAQIVQQVRDDAFRSEVARQVELLQTKWEVEHQQKVAKLETLLSKREVEAEHRLLDAVRDRDWKISDLENQLSQQGMKQELAEQQLRSEYEVQLKLKEEQLAYYRDFKARQSTKMVGESLEQHCLSQFNQMRMALFPDAYFEKDNDARSGSKGDFIFREASDGVELLSIMFEMKNEMDTTATKHKNEDFFKELDKDRREKGCEYAILVSLLEPESELYDGGIVDVSYRYPKMYVIRPQFFLPMITLLRNAALRSLDARRELHRIQSLNLDATRFEANLMTFKDAVSRNYDLASRNFQTALDEIDKSIDHLQKVRKALVSSERNLRLLNDKTEDLSIRKLTKDSPGIRAEFEAQGVSVK